MPAPSERHTEMQTLTAGLWVPLSLAMAHYTACDAMHLPVTKDGRHPAARIVETMEKRGLVGPSNGAKDREVLIDAM